MALTYGSYLKIDELLALQLKSALFQPLFPDLWTIRPQL